MVDLQEREDTGNGKRNSLDLTVENSPWKRLWTCSRKTGYCLNGDIAKPSFFYNECGFVEYSDSTLETPLANDQQLRGLQFSNMHFNYLNCLSFQVLNNTVLEA